MIIPNIWKNKNVPNHQPAIIGFVKMEVFQMVPSIFGSSPRQIVALLRRNGRNSDGSFDYWADPPRHLYDREEGPHRTTIIFWRRPFQSAKPFISLGFWAPYGSMINQGCAKTLWIAILDSVILTPDMGSWNCPRVPLCIKGALLYASRIGYS